VPALNTEVAMATTGISAGEAQARRHSATGPHDEGELASQGSQPPGLSTAAFSATRSRAAAPPEAGDGQTPIPSGALYGPGGNLLNGTFADPAPGEATSMVVRWRAPGEMTLDFGDGEEHETGGLPETVVHTYPALPEGSSSVVYDAVLRDPNGTLRGWVRFRLPHHLTSPADVRAEHPASTVV
jgi:hypothetical protein